ncbi:MAG: alpha/beta fold hydrolase, partial [Chitinophagaceae bacterium]
RWKIFITLFFYSSVLIGQIIKGYDGKGSYIKLNEVDFYYETIGEGKPVVMLHGGLGNSGYYSKIVDSLQHHYKLILFDTRGHGRSKGNETYFNYHILANDVHEFIKKIKLKDIVVIGHSDGGIIGYILAYKHPQSLSKLITIGANYAVEAYTEEIAKITAELTPELIEEKWKVKTSYKALNPHPEHYNVWATTVLKMWNNHYGINDEDIKKITTPTLIIVGDQDGFAKLDHFFQLYNLLPSGNLFVIPDAGHSPFNTNSTLFNSEVIRFINK